jgi:cell wall-associated NlpC family hydrolase
MLAKVSLRCMNARDKIVAVARAQVSKPYAYGVEIKDVMNQFDSSGLVVYCYLKAGIYLPRYLPQIIDRAKLINIESLQRADLVLFKGEGHQHPLFRDGVGHVAIYVGDDEIIEAVIEKTVVPHKIVQGIVRCNRFWERAKDTGFRGLLKILE